MGSGAWDQGCSLKQDGGYESYLLKRSTAPFAYQMSCVAPAACPANGPKFSECRSYAPGQAQIPDETVLRQSRDTFGRFSDRISTSLSGTSAYKGAGEATMSEVSVETTLRDGLWTGGACRRSLMEHVPGWRADFLNFTPRVEPTPLGGVSSRCNKLAFKRNMDNAFIATAPVPPPAVYFSPA